MPWSRRALAAIALAALACSGPLAPVVTNNPNCLARGLPQARVHALVGPPKSVKATTCGAKAGKRWPCLVERWRWRTLWFHDVGTARKHDWRLDSWVSDRCPVPEPPPPPPRPGR